MTNWIYKNEPVIDVPEDACGFVYVITNVLDGRKYFGKKKCFFKKTALKTITLKNGEKRKKKIRSSVSSDWLTYYGSSEELKKDVEVLGEENFTREILRFCLTLSELSYYEAKLQLETDCLLHPHLYYNKWISFRCRADHLVKSTHKTKPVTIASL